jgi:hemoglobin
MRHAPFAIGPAERDAWLGHMRDAITSLSPSPDVAARLHAYFEMAADAMRNRD